MALHLAGAGQPGHGLNTLPPSLYAIGLAAAFFAVGFLFIMLNSPKDNSHKDTRHADYQSSSGSNH
jgi:hypothetical protein